MEPRGKQRRHLPVLKEPQADDPGDPPRSPWQWAGFGAIGVFVVWVPLASLAARLVLRADGARASAGAQALLFATSLVLASLAGGYLVGRWGTRGVGARHAALAGLAAGVVASTMASGGLGLGLRAIVTAAAVVVAAPPAALGGRLGMKKRRGA